VPHRFGHAGGPAFFLPRGPGSLSYGGWWTRSA
jgi:hypothetical protein